jgi:hypothetical protein
MTRTGRPAPTRGPGAGLGADVGVGVVAASDGVIGTGSTPSSEARTAADKQLVIALIFIVALIGKRDRIRTVPK